MNIVLLGVIGVVFAIAVFVFGILVLFWLSNHANKDVDNIKKKVKKCDMNGGGCC